MSWTSGSIAWRFGAAALLLAVAPACGDDDDDDDVGGEGEGEGEGDAGPTDDAGPDAGPAVCGGTMVTDVLGHLGDVEGTFIDGSLIGLCLRAEQNGRETFVCLQPVPPEASGDFRVGVPAPLRCVRHAVVRLTAPGHATTYCPVEVEGSGETVRAPDWQLLPMPDEAPFWEPGDQEITLSSEDGATVSMRPSDLDEDVDRDLVRFRSVDLAEHRPCFLPEGDDLIALYILEPETTTLREDGLPAVLRDGSSADPGTPVTLYMLGGLHTILDGEVVQEGDWVPFAESVVGQDGSIPTPVGDGLPQLGWFGVRLRK